MVRPASSTPARIPERTRLDDNPIRPKVEDPRPEGLGAPPPNRIENRTSPADLNPLIPAAGMAARREFNGVPLNPNNALNAYKDMTAGSFAGPDDIRIGQISRVAARENVNFVRDLSQTMKNAGIDDAAVYGRAKTPMSLFGKLNETPGLTVGGIKDLSGARVDINASQPNFQQYYAAQEAAQGRFGDAMKLKADYIQNPNRWGYTGRMHSVVEGGNGVTHELQVGGKDVTGLIDKKLTTAGGQQISVHDSTFYKGDLHGARLTPELEGRYTQLMGRVTEANRAGKSVAEVPELAADVSKFMKDAEGALPANLPKPPAPQLSTAARIGNVASKGMGALGVVGGGFQVAEGVNQLQNGDKVEGGANVVGGTGSMVAGGAMIAGRMALGTTTGGAVAVVDGVKDIYVGVRDGNVEKGVVGGVKTGAGAAMIAGVATANPVLIAGGAVAYAGAVVYENREAIGNGIKSAWNWATSWW